MRRCIKEPIPEIFAAWEAMSEAVEEHLKGNHERAEALFRQANSKTVWEWLNPAWDRPEDHVIEKKPPGDTSSVPNNQRDPDRDVAPNVRAAVLERDGYRCRYCGIPVVHADIRKIAARLYLSAVVWDRDPSKRHAGFQCMWLQFDHVVPHSHGGRSTPDNVVISCALCNYGKFNSTLRQLHLEDPRLREPEHITGYDGLERLRNAKIPTPRSTNVKKPVEHASGGDLQHAELVRYFILGAWISAGYLFTPVIDGKERWFKLADDVRAEPAVRGGIEGCVLTCQPELLFRRGIEADKWLDVRRTDRE